MPTGNSLAVFSYIGQDVRTVIIDGQPWFVGNDIARALGYANPSDALAQIDADDRLNRTLALNEGSREVARLRTLVNEAGAYQLVFGSSLPTAYEFRRWLTHVVLPEIRQTGSFNAAPAPRALPHDFASALRELLTEVEHSAELTAELEVAQPRAEAWDAIASAQGDYSVGDAAKMLARAGIPTGPTRLFNQLLVLKWTYRGADGRPRAYADRVEKGYLAEKPSFHYHPGTGERVVDPPQVRVTLKGIERLRQRLHIGALAVVS